MAPTPAVRRWLCAGIAIVLMAGVSLWFARSDAGAPIGQIFTLPDGSTVRLEAVTYGKIHLPQAGPWRRLLAKLPSGLRRTLRLPNFNPHTTSEPQLIAWFTRSATSSYFEISVSDEEQTVGWRTSQSAYYSPGPSVQWHGIVFPAFPRRSRSLTLTLMAWDNAGGGHRSLGAFTIPNPARSRAASWPGGPPPVSATNGDLVLTLTQALTGVEFHDKEPMRARNLRDAALRLAYAVTDHDRPTADWKILSLRMLDVTGNDASASSWFSGYEFSSRGIFICQPSLWPGETWKLQIDLVRQTNFPPEQLIAARGLLPVAGVPWGNQAWTNTSAVVRQRWETNIAEAIATYSPNGGRWNLRTFFRMTNLTDTLHIDILSASNRLGKALTCQSSGNNGTVREFGFQECTNSMDVTNLTDVTFLITPRRRFELLVRPQMVSTN